MKFIICCLLVLSMNTLLAQQSSPIDAFLEKWEHSKNYLVEISEAMPEEHFNFKPTERQRSFKGQLLHIKDNMDWLSTSYFTDKEYKKGSIKEDISKAETISLITQEFDAAYAIIKITPEENLQETVEFFAGPKSKLQILNLLQDHVTHHRGQLIVYLNLQDIKPPRYVGW